MKQFRECFHKCLLENRKRNLTVGGPIPQAGIPDWKQKQKQIKSCTPAFIFLCVLTVDIT